MDGKHPSADGLTLLELVQAFAAVCRRAVRSTGGAGILPGEVRELLSTMEFLVAVVGGRLAKPGEPTVLDDLDRVDALLDRISVKLDVEFGAMKRDLNPLDNPKTHVAWMKECNADCKSTVGELRQSLEDERPILDRSGERLPAGRQAVFPANGLGREHPPRPRGIAEPPLPAGANPEAGPPEPDDDDRNLSDDHGNGDGEINVGTAELGARGTGADANLI
jgi:hypothetical protein